MQSFVLLQIPGFTSYNSRTNYISLGLMWLSFCHEANEKNGIHTAFDLEKHQVSLRLQQTTSPVSQCEQADNNMQSCSKQVNSAFPCNVHEKCNSSSPTWWMRPASLHIKIKKKIERGTQPLIMQW